jgi:ribosomal protein S1
MDRAAADQSPLDLLATLHVGDHCTGTVVEVTRSGGAAVTLDAFPAHPMGTVGPSDLSWRQKRSTAAQAGQRITAEVTAIDADKGRVELSMTATENPELWAFLKALHKGEILAGTIAAIERFGVFVALDNCPDHPVYPGVGFITIPELSWRHFQAATDIVQTGQRVTCRFLHFDTWNGEARLSLRATQPDPFQAFADNTAVGQTLHGHVTRLVPFGAFVQVADAIEGLIHLQELTRTPAQSIEEVIQVGDQVTTIVTAINREQRTLALSRRQALPDHP